MHNISIPKINEEYHRNITIIPKRVIKILEGRRNLWKAERQSYIQRRANNSNNEVRNKLNKERKRCNKNRNKEIIIVKESINSR